MQVVGNATLEIDKEAVENAKEASEKRWPDQRGKRSFKNKGGNDSRRTKNQRESKDSDFSL